MHRLNALSVFQSFSATSSGTVFLNPGATLNTPLSVGTNTFYLFGDAGTPQPFIGINLFLNGSTTPAVSAFAPENGTGLDFASNAGQPSAGLTLNTVPASPLTILVGGYQYTITLFSFNNTQQFGDKVGPFTASPNGINDYFGQVTINVTAVPEPSTIMLTATGLSGLLGMGWRRRRVSV